MKAIPDPFIEDASDRCVMCGMCIPQCPSYHLQHSEEQSPRGRIALLRAVNQSRLEATPPLLDSINRCLGCGRCEALCPSQVPYLSLLDHGRERLWSQQSWWWRRKQRLISHLLAQPRRLRRLLSLARLPLLRLALPKFLRKAPSARPRPVNIIGRGDKGKLLLLPGCANSAFDPTLHSAASTILRGLGYTVQTPTRDYCCGALAQHAGDQQLARQQAHALSDSDTRGIEHILHPASACSQHLQQYSQLLGDEGKAFATASEDLSAFILHQDWPADWPWRDETLRLLLHIPCSQQAEGGRLQTFLQALPGIEVTRLQGGAGCCGAAGSYMLNYPREAARLRRDLLGDTDQYKGYDYLVSGNIGCQLHLQAGLEHLDVIHPLMLIYRHSQL